MRPLAAMKSSKGIFIVKQDLLLCQTLKEALQVRHLFVCGYATTGKEAISMLSALRPDVALIGAELPDMSGLEIIKFIKQQQLPCRCIVYSKVSMPIYLKQGMEYGIKGYLYANSGFAELHYCIHEVMEGREYIVPSGQQIVESPGVQPPNW